MICPKCQMDSREDVRFCEECAHSLVGPAPQLAPQSPTVVGHSRGVALMSTSN